MAQTQIRGGASQRSEPWLLSSGVGRGPLLFAASASESQSADDFSQDVEMREVFVNRDDPDEEEGVEGEDDEHGHLHHPQVTVFFFHEHAGRFLRI